MIPVFNTCTTLSARNFHMCISSRKHVLFLCDSLQAFPHIADKTIYLIAFIIFATAATTATRFHFSFYTPLWSVKLYQCFGNLPSLWIFINWYRCMMYSLKITFMVQHYIALLPTSCNQEYFFLLHRRFSAF
jgi:hypothetical protein